MRPLYDDKSGDLVSRSTRAKGGGTPSSHAGGSASSTGVPLFLQRQADEREKGGKVVPTDVITITPKIEDAEPLPPELQGMLKAYFLVTWDHRREDSYTYKPEGMSEKVSLQDEMATLESMGYLVVYNENATETDIIAAYEDANAVFILTTGHGDPPGTIRTVNSESVSPDEITIPAGSKLRFTIQEHCHVGDDLKRWQELLGDDVEIVSWTGKTSVRVSVRFNTTGWFDGQWGSLMSRVTKLETLTSQTGQILSIDKEVAEPYDVKVRPESMDYDVDPSLLTVEEIDHEIMLIREYLRENRKLLSAEDIERLENALSRLEPHGSPHCMLPPWEQ